MKQLKPALMTFILLTFITGIIYPLFITGIGHVFSPAEANGSLVRVDGEVIGSSLIGQNFSDEKYLWSRPSATGDRPYNPLASGGSNLGPSNPQLLQQIKERTVDLDANPMTPVPIDLVTTSASGLDPEISIAAAYYQVARIARVRGISQDKVLNIINKQAKTPLFGIWGEARVNVLLVNLALDNTRYEVQ